MDARCSISTRWPAAARTGVPEQGPEDHADRRARRSGEDARVHLQRRHRRVHQAPEPRQTVLHEKPIYFEGERELPNGGTLTMEVALQYNDAYSENVFSFANNINTVDGGTHLSGFRSALTRTINAAGQAAGLFKDVKENLTGDDVREGLTAVISVKLPQPQFEGQTKGKLNSDISGLRDAVRQREAGRVLRQESGGDEEDRRQGDRGVARARSGAQGARSDAAQRRARFRRPAGQAGGLPGAGSGALRAVPGRGRIGRRHREAGPRPALSRRSCR